MKKIITLWLALVPVLAYAQNYRIEGIAPGMDGNKVYLKEYKKEPIDSAMIVNGKFKLENRLQEVKPMIVSIGRTQQNILLDENPICLEYKTVSREVNGRIIHSGEFSMKGDIEQSLLLQMRQALSKEMITMLALSFANEEGDKVAKDSLGTVFMQVKEESRNLFDSIVTHYKDSYVSAIIINEHLVKERSFGELQSLYAQLTDRVKQSAPGQKLKQTLESLRLTGIGQPAPDFTLQTPAGKSLSLSDLRGKVVLIDFWASWCGPCIKEIPNVKKIYEKYNGKGFEIISVSLDNKRENWTQAIAKHQLPWLNVCSLKGWQCPVVKQYNVSGVPAMFLIDAEGKIAATDLRGEQMLDEAVGRLCK